MRTLCQSIDKDCWTELQFWAESCFTLSTQWSLACSSNLCTVSVVCQMSVPSIFQCHVWEFIPTLSAKERSTLSTSMVSSSLPSFSTCLWFQYRLSTTCARIQTWYTCQARRVQIQTTRKTCEQLKRWKVCSASSLPASTLEMKSTRGLKTTKVIRRMRSRRHPLAKRPSRRLSRLFLEKVSKSASAKAPVQSKFDHSSIGNSWSCTRKWCW